LGPNAIPRDASIKSVAFSAAYRCVDDVCITLLTRNFVSFIHRNQTRYGGIPEHGHTFNADACHACYTDAGMRN
jgi:hypothetical protein